MAHSSRSNIPTARRVLDFLYLAGAFLGAWFVVVIGLLITAQVVGREFGQQVKGADDLTAWSVAAAAFLPLAYTYRANGHIRVTLLVERSQHVFRQFWEGSIALVSLFFSAYLTYSTFDMIWDSIRFGDLSQNIIVIPIWIPQSSLAIGALLFTIALLDDLVVSLMGGKPGHMMVKKVNPELE